MSNPLARLSPVDQLLKIVTLNPASHCEEVTRVSDFEMEILCMVANGVGITHPVRSPSYLKKGFLVYEIGLEWSKYEKSGDLSKAVATFPILGKLSATAIVCLRVLLTAGFPDTFRN